MGTRGLRGFFKIGNLGGSKIACLGDFSESQTPRNILFRLSVGTRGLSVFLNIFLRGPPGFPEIQVLSKVKVSPTTLTFSVFDLNFLGL